MIFAVLERRLIQLLIKWLQFFISNIDNEHCKILLQNYLKAKIQLYVPSLDREMSVATVRTICNITMQN